MVTIVITVAAVIAFTVTITVRFKRRRSCRQGMLFPCFLSQHTPDSLFVQVLTVQGLSYEARQAAVARQDQP
jgi:hypothetical protein